MVTTGTERLTRACAENCLGEFSLVDYAPGYFRYKYQVRKSSGVNLCPMCEVVTLKSVIAKGNLSWWSKGSVSADVRLLETWRLDGGVQREKCVRTHGDHVLRMMEDAAEMEDRARSGPCLVKQVVLAGW